MDVREIEEMRSLEDDHWWFVGKRLVLDALLRPLLAPGSRVLDVGCGTGAVLEDLRRRARVVGVDPSTVALSYCRARGIGQVACASGDRLPFAPRSFDAVLLLDVLEHFRDETALLAGVRALLRPGGVLLVSVPAYQFLWSAHDDVLQHVRRYTAAGLRGALERAGLRVQRLTHTNVAAFPPALVVRGVLQRLGLGRGGRTDFRRHAHWLNRTLIGTYQLEAAALRRGIRLPVGLSVAAIATPAADDGAPSP